MKRLLPILAMALLGLSGCDSGTVVSPVAPEVGQPSFAKAGLPAIEATVACPTEGGNILFPEVTLNREPGAPAAAEGTFGRCDFTEATLVVQVSNPKTTTVKAWLNGVMVLHPSEFPRTGETEFRLTFLLDDLNGLEVRLSAKPGEDYWATVWVEGVGTPTPTGGNETTVDFQVTTASFDLTADLNAACVGQYGAGYGIADWSQVSTEVGDEQNTSIIPVEGLAWITSDGYRSYVEFFLSYYYLISGSSTLSEGFKDEGKQTDPEGFWLVSALDYIAGQHPVLCVSTS